MGPLRDRLDNLPLAFRDALCDPSLALTVQDVEALLPAPRYRAVTRQLRAAGLPGWRVIRPWLVLFTLERRLGQSGQSLCAWALAQGIDGSPCYRLTKQTTGRTWTQLVQLGPEWLEDRALQAFEEAGVESQTGVQRTADSKGS